MMRRSAAALFVIACACDRSPQTETKALKIAAAADLAFAFKDIGAQFEKKTGEKVVFSFGSTGLLAKQIAEGAPFDVFAAANVSFVDNVVEEEQCAADSKARYARGRIVLWWKTGDGVVAPKSLEELADARFVRIAIANPEHAPYGRAAQEALAKSGVLDAVKPKLVFGENVQQTLQFAQSGNVEAAIVALSLATVTEGGQYLVIDELLHETIDQALVVCSKNDQDQERARRFTAFVNSDEGRAIMRRYGFLLPGESLALVQ